MDDHEQRSEKYIPSNTPENTKKAGSNKKISGLIRKAHSINALQFIAGFSQIFLGTAVIIISILGYVQPVWLSTSLSIVASFTTMTGIYFCYCAVKTFDADTLLRDAMRRIVEEQN